MLSSEFAQNTDDMQSMYAMVAAIRVLAMLVGGIVVANTMIMSIFERTREIGTLRALGWAAGRILGQILQESLYLCLPWRCCRCVFWGGLFDVDFADSGGCSDDVANLDAADLYHRLCRWRWGRLGGLYPAWRASQLRPVEALRYE